ncbi:hypothetical protein [Pseudactinotalea sp.]|uniref:hypothetical protein n=1 Tax=Pseudactinotalea sp. TaxID=1926260 RepID=UPI003B3B4AAE
MSIDFERSVPAWLLRAVSAAGVLLLAPVVGDVVVPVLAAAAIMLLPHPGTVAALLLIGAGFVWNQPPSLLVCATFALVLHAVAVLVRLTAPLPPTGRIEGRLVLRAFAAFAVIQVLVQAMIGLSFAAMAGLPVFTWFAVLAVAGIAVAIVAGVRWVARHTQ